MIPTIYSAGLDGTAPRWCKAFARGCGGQVQQGVQQGEGLREGALALFGHASLEPMLFEAQRQGRTWYYGDHAFFGRGQYFRCAKNAYQHDGLQGDADPKRFLKFGIPIRPWRQAGSHIVLCPNSESFLARHGAPDWVEQTVAALQALTDRRIVLRWKTHAEKRPLALDLVDAWAVVTFTSNSAVEGILAGVPAICTAPCAGAGMGSSNLADIEAPVMPDGRLDWAARLANNQWTLDQMAAGELWRAIGET